eukprot:TRINITY_DN10963_c0_g1_i1.p1 TRINITY_DN10963_c0_g1~~TRINITY_DN10963_c0_g1_i1.p1  ORF type:complete len:472 (-),score=131.61 TRINITY_DN10963_c0_g1_i1:90-1505(-)
MKSQDRPRLEWMLRVVILSVGWIVRSRALVHGASDDIVNCHCECCLTELQRAEEGDGSGNAWSRLQCAYDAAASAAENRCGNLCRRSSNDTVLAAAEAQEMDTQRFCFFECEPMPRQGPTLPAVGPAQPGDGCKPLTKSEALAVGDSGGNARNPMDTPQVMSHFLIARTVASSGSGSQSTAKLQSLASAQAGPPPPTVSAGPWHSVLSGLAMEQGAKVAAAAQEAEKDAAAATAAYQAIDTSAIAAGGALMNAMSKAQDAQKAAEEAAKAEKRVKDIREGLLRRAKKAALDDLPIIMKKMREAADAKAKAKAQEQAAKTKQEWEKAGPLAAAEAMKGWETAMARAADTANKYVATANELGAQSMAMQTNAQTANQQANLFTSMGDTVQAQKQIVQEHQMMDAAQGLNSQAAKYYDIAASIQQTLPNYVEQANAAGYHAELMANPDAPPPGVPLVLTQSNVKSRKLRARSGN